MARSSGSSNKQPAFDPGDLQYLIFSPAVGSGVGSHLLGTTENLPAPTETQENKTHHASTVDTSISPTVANMDVSTVDMLNRQQTAQLRSAASILQHLPLVTKVLTEAKRDMSTVDISDSPTV